MVPYFAKDANVEIHSISELRNIAIGNINETYQASDSVISNLNAAENEISALPKEKMYIFDSNGKKVYEKNGKEYSVTVSEKRAKTFSNKILTHNHPADGSESMSALSGLDIEFAMRFNLKQIRAVSLDEIGVVTRPEIGWGDYKTVVQMYESLKKEFGLKEAMKIYTNSPGKKVSISLSNKHFIEINKRLAEHFGYKFETIKLIKIVKSFSKSEPEYTENYSDNNKMIIIDDSELYGVTFTSDEISEMMNQFSPL
jgi:hypothetical protein